MVLRAFGDKSPHLGMDVYVDESAVVIGDVHLHDGASVWPGVVIRGDDARVDVGKGSAMMDVSFAEAPSGKPVVVSERCLISHGARLHGCVIMEGCLVGVGAIVLDGAHIGAGTVVAAGTLVPPGARIPQDSVAMGSPFKVVRPAGPSDRDSLDAELRRIASKIPTYRASSRL